MSETITLTKSKISALVSPYNDLFNQSMSVPMKEIGEFKYKYHLNYCETEEIEIHGVKYLKVIKPGNRIENIRMSRITVIIR